MFAAGFELIKFFRKLFRTIFKQEGTIKMNGFGKMGFLIEHFASKN